MCNVEVQAHSHDIHRALNKLLVEQLFKVQDTQELNDSEKVSSICIKHLYELAD